MMSSVTSGVSGSVATRAKPRAIIAGGSLGGLLAGNLLHRAGWHVEIYERAKGPLDGRGAGIVTHPELREILLEAGVAANAPLGVWVESRRVFDRSGSIIAQTPLKQCLTGWSRLYQLLLDVFPRDCYTDGRAVVRAEQSASSVTATFDDGSTRGADLLIAADGIRSVIRTQLAGSIEPRYAGYIAWRGLCEENALPHDAHRDIFEHFAFCLPDREQMLGYPVAGARDDITVGNRRYNFVWYRPADEATQLAALCTDATGKVHAGSIPPPLIRPQVIAQMREHARDVLAPQFAAMVSATTEPFFQPIYDVESPRLAFNRIALLGDAAFVARPHCGMGVTKAAGDAYALVQALAGASSVESALVKYEASRLPFGAGVVAHARHLGAYMQAQQKSAEQRAMAERYRTPDAVMRETAVPVVL